MQQQKQTLKAHLISLQRDYLNSSLAQLSPVLGLDQQVITDVLGGALRAMQQDFVQEIVNGVIEVKAKEREARALIAKKEEEHNEAIKRVTQEQRDKYESIAKTSAYSEAIISEIKLLLGTETIVSSIKKLISDNTQMHISLTHRDSLLTQSCFEIKQLRETEIHLVREIQSIRAELEAARKLSQINEINWNAKVAEAKEAFALQKVKWTQEKERQMRQLRNEKNTQVALINDTKLVLQSTLNQQIAAVGQKLELSKKECSDLSNQILLLNNQIIQKIAQISAIKQESLNLQTGTKYLQQENNFLREQIEKFQQKKKLLEADNSQLVSSKQNIEHQHQQLKEEYVELIESHETLLKQHSCNIQQGLSLREELQAHKQELQTLKEEISTYIQYHKITTDELKLMEEELIRVQKKHAEDIASINFKKNEEAAMMLDERIELEVENKELSENVKLFQSQVEKFKDQQKYYETYLEQIALLKKQMRQYNPNKNELLYDYNYKSQLFEPINKKSKIFFMLSKASEEVKILRQKCKQFNTKLEQERQLFKNYLKETVLFVGTQLICKTIECSFCQHQKHQKLSGNHQTLDSFLDNTIKTKYGKRQIPKISSASYGSIKKSVKDINTKYKKIEQENMNFTNHLHGFLNFS